MISLYFDITPKAKQSFRMGKHSYQSKAVTDYQKAITAMALAQTTQDTRLLSDDLYVSVEFVWGHPNRGERSAWQNCEKDAYTSHRARI